MHFTIITPSFNQLGYLKRCVASVADQVTESMEHGAGRIEVCHHVQDGGSTDGAREWLECYANEVREQNTEDTGQRTEDCSPNAECLAPGAYTFTYASAPDNGMYDAINKGVAFALNRSTTSLNSLKQASPSLNPCPNDFNVLNLQHSTKPRDSVIAWLNCDEQYLPGTLHKVAVFFEQHPEVDIVFGGMLMVDEAGKLLACRKAMPMRRLFLEASYLYNYSCAMFFRRSAWEKLGGFDSAYRNAGDEELVRRAMKLGMKTAVVDGYLSVFTYAGHNLSSEGTSAVQEHERLKQSESRASRWLRLPINLARLAEKWMRGGLHERGALVFEIYTDPLEARSLFEEDNPSCHWPGEVKPYLLNHRLSDRR